MLSIRWKHNQNVFLKQYDSYRPFFLEFKSISINNARDFWSPNCMNIDGNAMFSIQWNRSFHWTQIKIKLSRYPSPPYIKIGFPEWLYHLHRRGPSGCPIRLPVKTSNLADKCPMTGANLQPWVGDHGLQHLLYNWAHGTPVRTSPGLDQTCKRDDCQPEWAGLASWDLGPPSLLLEYQPERWHGVLYQWWCCERLAFLLHLFEGNFRWGEACVLRGNLLHSISHLKLTDYLNANRLQEMFQSAYKGVHSTETALLTVQSNMQSINRKVFFSYYLTSQPLTIRSTMSSC